MSAPPELPPRPDPAERPRGSWLALMLAASAMLALIVTLTFITLGYFGPVLVVGAVMGGIVLFHYVVWGWWLPHVLRQAAEEEAEDS